MTIPKTKFTALLLIGIALLSLRYRLLSDLWSGLLSGLAVAVAIGAVVVVVRSRRSA